MTLGLTDTMKRSKEPFPPAIPDQVKIYVCGPTVEDRTVSSVWWKTP